MLPELPVETVPRPEESELMTLHQILSRLAEADTSPDHAISGLQAYARTYISEMTRTCQYCGKGFVGAHASRKYCSPTCRQYRYRDALRKRYLSRHYITKAEANKSTPDV